MHSITCSGRAVALSLVDASRYMNKKRSNKPLPDKYAITLELEELLTDEKRVTEAFAIIFAEALTRMGKDISPLNKILNNIYDNTSDQ